MTYKSKLTRLTALLLAMMLVLSACGAKKTDDGGSENANTNSIQVKPQTGDNQSAKPDVQGDAQTGDTDGTEDAEAQGRNDPDGTDENTAALPSFEEQAAVIAEQYCDWSEFLEGHMNPAAAITDLDQNGRLELIISSCEGSGLFSYSHFFELDEALKLQPLDFPRAEEGSEPDIISEYLECYYSGETGIYSYLTEDIMHNGYRESYSMIDVLSKTGSLIDYFCLGSSSRVVDAQETLITEFYDFGNEAVTETEYYALADNYLDCTQKYLAHINWISADDFDQLGVPEALRISAGGFCLTPWEPTPYLDGNWVLYGKDGDEDGLSAKPSASEPAIMASLYIYAGNSMADLHWYDLEWEQEDTGMPIKRMNGALYSGCGNDAYYLEMNNPTDYMGYYLVVLDENTLRFVVYDWDSYDEHGPLVTDVIFCRE